jgi:hypothetical protein
MKFAHITGYLHPKLVVILFFGPNEEDSIRSPPPKWAWRRPATSAAEDAGRDPVGLNRGAVSAKGRRCAALPTIHRLSGDESGDANDFPTKRRFFFPVRFWGRDPASGVGPIRTDWCAGIEQRNICVRCQRDYSEKRNDHVQITLIFQHGV